MGADDMELQASTWCNRSACADGVPPDELPDVGSRSDVRFTFAATGWEFEAALTQTDTACPRSITVPGGREDDTYVLGPAGPPATWGVSLVGRGGGEVITGFRWTTTEQGTMPEPQAVLGLISEKGGKLGSYGFELGIQDIAAYEDVPTAEVTVVAAGGEALTFEARGRPTCGAAGTVFFNQPKANGHEAARLGKPPFAYTVRLTLNDVVYVGTGIYPDDVVDDWHGYVALTFDPPLPAYPAEPWRSTMVVTSRLSATQTGGQLTARLMSFSIFFASASVRSVRA